MPYTMKTNARIAGLLYLMVIAGGMFAELGVRSKLVVHGDAAATARQILAHQTLYRLGFAVELFYCALNVLIVLQFYKLFRVVNRDLTLLVLFFSLTGTAVEAASLVAHIASLVFLSEGMHAFNPAQLAELAFAWMRCFNYGFNIALVFFGGYCICMGILIFRSGFMPRIIGIFLGFQGCCYLLNSFAWFLSPALAARIFPVLMIAAIGEFSFCFWLLVMGVKEDRWRQLAAARSSNPSVI